MMCEYKSDPVKRNGLNIYSSSRAWLCQAYQLLLLSYMVQLTYGIFKQEKEYHKKMKIYSHLQQLPFWLSLNLILSLALLTTLCDTLNVFYVITFPNSTIFIFTYGSLHSPIFSTSLMPLCIVIVYVKHQ